MFSGADLEPILRRFKVVTSAELGQQVMFKQQRVISEISFFNHPTQGAAEQPGEQAEQGVGEEQPGDGPQVQKCLI